MASAAERREDGSFRAVGLERVQQGLAGVGVVAHVDVVADLDRRVARGDGLGAGPLVAAVAARDGPDDLGTVLGELAGAGDVGLLVDALAGVLVVRELPTLDHQLAEVAGVVDVLRVVGVVGAGAGRAAAAGQRESDPCQGRGDRGQLGPRHVCGPGGVHDLALSHRSWSVCLSRQ